MIYDFLLGIGVTRTNNRAKTETTSKSEFDFPPEKDHDALFAHQFQGTSTTAVPGNSFLSRLANCFQLRYYNCFSHG